MPTPVAVNVTITFVDDKGKKTQLTKLLNIKETKEQFITGVGRDSGVFINSNDSGIDADQSDTGPGTSRWIPIHRIYEIQFLTH